MRSVLPRLLAALLVTLSLTLATTGASALTDGRMAMFDARISHDGNSVAFSYYGDIWVADVATGMCRRITDHVAEDATPVWFPDDLKIAFSSNREGNDDIYTVPAAGGVPTRHTWHGNYDIPLDVSPDGGTILLRSYRRLYSSDLYEIDLNGGLERPITNDMGLNLDARYSPDGSKIVVSRGASGWTRRHYNGSGDTDIYEMNRDGSDIRWIENAYDGNDMWPCYGANGEYLYFVSDRDGTENVFRKSLISGEVEQLTHFTDRPVLFMSVSDSGRIAFIQNFNMWIIDPGEQNPRMVDLDCATEPKHSQDVRLDIAGNVSEIEISPLGTHLAIIARGELYITPLHEPDAVAPLGDEHFWESVRVTETPSRERYVAWHPDGDRVVLTSDRDGNMEVYEINLRTFEWTRLTETYEEEYLPNYSPDGKYLAYYRGNDKFIVRDMASGDERTVRDQPIQTSPWPPNYAWSPDSRWIAYTGLNDIEYADVYVVGIADDSCNGEVNVTRYHDDDYFQGWSDDGKSIYFMSARDISYGLNGWGSWNLGYTLYSLPLQREPAPRSDVLEFPAPDEESEAETGDETEIEHEEDAEENSGLTVNINFDRIEERSRKISTTRGGGYRAALSPDCKTFVYEANPMGVAALWSIPFDGGSTTHIADAPDGIEDIEWLGDGRGVFWLSGGKVRFWNQNSGAVQQVPTNGRLTINLAAERRQMIYETGRLLRDHFYDPALHGMDWDGAIEYYAPLVEEASDPERFATLMRMLFGELDASHLGCYAALSNEGITANPGYLGIEFDAYTAGPGLIVSRVIPRGPADYDESRINTGEWVMSINGVPISTSMNYWSLLDDSVARTTVLEVASDQDGTDSREVEIAPARWWSGDPNAISYWDISYAEWVDRNRGIVQQASDGKIGYVHIAGMSGPELEKFARDLFSENLDKDALIIDVRYNGGGNTHEQLIDILSRPQFGWSQGRDMSHLPEPNLRWDRPTVVLINERSFSDAEIFPSAFRDAGLGTLIGEETFGGVIGTWTIPLVDGQTRIRIPRNGWYTLDGTNMENIGVEPDIRVVEDLNRTRDGYDDQLIAAVDYLLGEI